MANKTYTWSLLLWELVGGRGCIVFKVSFTNLTSLLHEPVKHVQSKNITYWKQLKSKIIVLSPVPCIESCHVLSLKIQGFKNTCRETQELESPLWGIDKRVRVLALKFRGFKMFQRHSHIFSANSNGRPKSTELKEFFGDFFSQLFRCLTVTRETLSLPSKLMTKSAETRKASARVAMIMGSLVNLATKSTSMIFHGFPFNSKCSPLRKDFYILNPRSKALPCTYWTPFYVQMNPFGSS